MPLEPNQIGTTTDKAMQLVDSGIICRAQPNGPYATCTHPTIAVLSNGRVLVAFRHGSTKDSDDESVEIVETRDNGQTWSKLPFTAPTMVNGKRGTAHTCHITEIEPNHLLGAVMWVDRETYAGKPLFNAQTEGCLPMAIVLSDSHDGGATWSTSRMVPMPPEIGPPSLTSAIMKLPDGTLAMSIETNKAYDDRSQWFQRTVILHSTDGGKNWGPPITASRDATGRIFYWDQRTQMTREGGIVAFLWTYDSTVNTYLNIHRNVSQDGGKCWTGVEDLGFADQAGHPAILPCGSVVLPYVDRFNSRRILARSAPGPAAAFDPDSEVVIYSHALTDSRRSQSSVTAALAEMGLWSYGLPYADALPGGDVMVVYYAGSNEAMDLRWANLRMPRSE